MADGEYHVASYVIRTRPEHAKQVAAHIGAMPGLEVHAAQEGKLVVTAEARDVRQLADIAGDLGLVDSVIAVAPIYHEYSGAEDRASVTPQDEH